MSTSRQKLIALGKNSPPSIFGVGRAMSSFYGPTSNPKTRPVGPRDPSESVLTRLILSWPRRLLRARSRPSTVSVGISHTPDSMNIASSTNGTQEKGTSLTKIGLLHTRSYELGGSLPHTWRISKGRRKPSKRQRRPSSHDVVFDPD